MEATYDYSKDMVTVTLSERNLLALLAQLRDPDRPAPALIRAGVPQLHEPTVLVQAQSDEDHYTERAPGRMRLSTEQGMVDVRREFGFDDTDPED